MCCCGIFGCISKILGQLLTGCIPIALGVYIGLLCMWIACFMIWSTFWFGAEILSLHWKHNFQYDLYIKLSMNDQEQALWNNSKVEYTTIDSDDPEAVCKDGVDWYSGISGVYNFMIICMLFLAHAGALKHFSVCQPFSKIPCKMCIARILMWCVALLTLLIWFIFMATCLANFGTKEDEINAGGLATDFELKQGPGFTNMWQSIILLLASGIILCVFFIPKGQKLFPGFMASEVADEAEEESKDSGDVNDKQSACSVESAASTLSTLSSAEESKGDSKLEHSEDDVELEVER